MVEWVQVGGTVFHKRHGPHRVMVSVREERMRVPMGEAERGRVFPSQWSTIRGIKQFELQSNYYGSSLSFIIDV